ncbi:hypothetical protein NPX13_g2193 [Xylaria arbuscula]|uniref:Uncharacterized protein n=1 Tax=Xylaria arbuscula TaxID=114810 RepID=A0A9W8NK90_9PEZI|nr:hypothetical protein NPX13_g2193 [Xylaria arbuscula]
MFGSKITPFQTCVQLDIEMAHDEQMERMNSRPKSDDGPHMAALQTLFGFDSEQMRQVRELPATVSWCRYLEDCFLPLLTEEYAVIWSTIGLPQPQVISHCWGLFQAVSHAISKQDDAGYSIEDVWKSIVFSLNENAELGVERGGSVNHGCPAEAGLERRCGGSYTGNPPTPCQPPWLEDGFCSTADSSSFSKLSKGDSASETYGKAQRRKVYSPLRVYHKLPFIMNHWQLRALFSNDSEGTEDIECNHQLSQEVLMSYRLLFGQYRASRKVARALLQEMEEKHDYDQLLACLCTKSRKETAKMLPETSWPISCRDYDNNLQEADSYSSQDDFPILGSRLIAIQEFNLRQQPSKLRDLWRDRRSPLQWYTFWAVLLVGGLSILLAILQLVAAIVQVVNP